MQRNRIIWFLLIFMLFFVCLSSPIYAQEEPTIQCSSAEVAKGGSAMLSLNINDVVNYSALDIKIYYDSALFTISNAYFGYLINYLPQHEKVMNMNAPGEISFALITTENTSAEGSLLYFYIQPKEQTAVNNYTFFVAVVGAYDQNGNPILINTIHGNVSVIEQQAFIQPISYSSQTSLTNLQQGDDFTYTITSYSTYQLAASDYEIIYDWNLIKLKEVRLGQALLGINAISAVHTLQPGFIKIGYASSIGIDYATPLFQIDFEVIANVEIESFIEFTPKNSYNVNLHPLGGNKNSTTINIVKTPIVIDYPNLSISSFEGPFSEAFTIFVELEANSNLAAGDFIISYNHNLLQIESIEEKYSSSYFVYQHFPAQGKISFSVLNSEGFLEKITFLSITMKALDVKKPLSTGITIQGSDVVDKEILPLSLEYQNSNITLTQYHLITFEDYDGSIIDSSLVKEGSMPTAPSVNLRTNTQFLSWSKEIVPATAVANYKAIYQLDGSKIEFQNQTFEYQGIAQSIEVSGLPLGGSVAYQNNNQMEVGIYYVEASISLDGVFQFEKISKLAIEPRAITITVENKIMDEMGDLPIWTFFIDRLITGDNLGITVTSETGFTAGKHVLSATINNSNYSAQIIPGELTVIAYDWIYGDLNYDKNITILDVALIQLYLASVITFTNMQINIADTNQDSAIGIADAARMQLKIADMIEDWVEKPSNSLEIQSLSSTYGIYRFELCVI